MQNADQIANLEHDAVTGAKMTIGAYKTGILDQNVTVPAGASYYTPTLATNGYRYAQIALANVSGTFNVNGMRQSLLGTLTFIHNAGVNVPSGMGGSQNYATVFNPPINDAVSMQYTNASSTAQATIGQAIYSLSN